MTLNGLSRLTLGLTLALGASLCAAQNKTLVYCAPSDPQGFDMPRWTTTQTIDAAGLTIYDRLVEFEPATLKLLPGLAEKWTVSADGKAYTFTIRKGVKFHSTDYFKPTRDLNVDDVVFSMERYRDTDSAFNKAYGVSNYPYNSWAKNLTSVEKVDANTMRLNLKVADATTMANLGMVTSIVTSLEYAEQLQKAGKLANLDSEPIGTGPCIMRRYDKDAQVRYDANAQYWGGKPKVDRLVIQTVKDAAVRLQKVKVGECHIGSNPRPQDLATIRADSNLVLQEVGGLNIGYIGLNTEKKPFDNKDVRKAINYAVNRENLIEAVLYGLGEEPATLVGPTELGFDPSGKEISRQDLAKAQEHIAASGLTTPIPLTFTYESNRFWPQMAELIKGDLEAVGFAVTLDAQDAGSYWGKIFGGQAQLSMNQRSLWIPDPDDKVALLQSGGSGAQFETGIVTALPEYSAKMDELLAAGKSEQDPEKRVAIYQEIQAMILEELPYIMLAYYTKPTVMATNVEGLLPGAAATERIFLEKVWLS